VIRILAIHNTDLSSREVLAKMRKRYITLSKYPDLFKIRVVKYGTKIEDIPVPTKKYDQLYYHKATVDPKTLIDYLMRSGATELIDFSLEEKNGKEESDKQTKKNKIHIVSSRGKKTKAQSK